MPPQRVSASTFLELKAQLVQQEDKVKAAGRPSAIVGAKRDKDSDNKISRWSKQNAGVQARAARDVELEAVSRRTYESARANLEHKAHVYEQLRKGKSAGLSDAQYDTQLVDFDQKAIDHYESDDDDVDESLIVPKAPENEADDPIVEYEDEFGRVRTARRSEVPREALQRQDEVENNDDPYVIHDPVNHFPIYEPDAERVARIAEELAESESAAAAHYDASKEVRATGAGFYQFAGDEETRERQMRELRAAREETERARQEAGALNVRPGVEGLHEDDESVVGARSRAMEKRKREVEERRRLVEEKRRKIGARATPTVGANVSSTGAAEPVVSTNVVVTPAAPQLQAHREAASSSAQKPPPGDPFATLEAQSVRGKGEAKETQLPSPISAADAFLDQLAQEMLKGAKS
ncbi:hypothetical protein BKA93DRAFT_753106 [Sparassis latifolia]